MTSQPTFTGFAARLREFIRGSTEQRAGSREAEAPRGTFGDLVSDLFSIQFACNAPFRRLCEARRVCPPTVADWDQIPAMPTSAFKELDVSCLPPAERTAVFRSSGTTGQRPSRHFHSTESLAIYEASLLPWFARHLLSDRGGPWRMLCLTPPSAAAPCSSLIHMFATVQRELGAAESVFAGEVNDRGNWGLDLATAKVALDGASKDGEPLMILGTAFNLVHLLDQLVEKSLRLQLPLGSRVMETGGYKGRSRNLSRLDLHALIAERLGIPAHYVVCEYGMSELSSQAYDGSVQDSPSTSDGPARVFRFPPWARAQVVSPETGCEVAEGETGLIRVFDLANVWSVMAVQTEDLGVRRGDGFELIGRCAQAEPRGCSRMTA